MITSEQDNTKEIFMSAPVSQINGSPLSPQRVPSQSLSQREKKIVTLVISLFIAIASFACLFPLAALLVTLLSSILVYKITSYLPKKVSCSNSVPLADLFSRNRCGQPDKRQKFGPEPRIAHRLPTTGSRHQVGAHPPSQARSTIPPPSQHLRHRVKTRN